MNPYDIMCHLMPLFPIGGSVVIFSCGFNLYFSQWLTMMITLSCTYWLFGYHHLWNPYSGLLTFFLSWIICLLLIYRIHYTFCMWVLGQIMHIADSFSQFASYLFTLINSVFWWIEVLTFNQDQFIHFFLQWLVL